MTVTKRKAIHRDPTEERVPSQTGVSYACDVCAADISHTVRVRCAHVDQHAQEATCQDFDLCGSCFVGGKEVGRHRRWHDYRVVEPHAYPIFNNEWGADEELLLIDACQQYGLGNWMDIAEHIGSFRTKEDVERHYHFTYLQSPDFPYPVIEENLDPDQDRFQQRKKARLEAAQSKPPPVPVPKPGPSVPVCHEVGGFMPARLEFEHEFDNEAEVLIKDMDFGLVMRYGGSDQPRQLPPHDPEQEQREGSVQVKQEEDTPQVPPKEDTPANNANDDELTEEDPDDLDLKLAILDMYNERIHKRLETKSLLFDRNLVDYRKIQAADKKRSKEEKDLIQRNKVFSRLHTRTDHDAYVDGLLYEFSLRKRIAELQEYRTAGLTAFSEVEKYERDKGIYVHQLAKGLHVGREWAKQQKQGLARHGLKRAPPGPLTLGSASSLSLLTPDEQALCASLQILPKPFLFIKQHTLREWASRGGQLSRSEACALFPNETAAVVGSIYAHLFDEPDQELGSGPAPEPELAADSTEMEVDAAGAGPSVDVEGAAAAPTPVVQVNGDA